MHVSYTCEREPLCLYVVMGVMDLSMPTCTSILTTELIYANVYVTNMCVSLTPVSEYMHMKQTWDQIDSAFLQ